MRASLRLMLIPLLTTIVGGLVAGSATANPLSPMVSPGRLVDWWFAFKFNAHTAPSDPGRDRSCPFGGQPQPYRAFSQAFATANSENPTLTKDAGLIGAGDDPLGLTFQELYRGAYHYVLWNDQFYDDPVIAGCRKSCSGSWGHSKGFLAWDDRGAGFVVQVSTPDWPGAGSTRHPRKTEGNTLGCVLHNDVLVSQHFFALMLTHDDVISVLQALANASVVTDTSNPQLVDNGGPTDIQAVVSSLGKRSASQTVLSARLSTGIVLISKPSALHLPPWQMLSATLGGIPLRVATWWMRPQIPSTIATSSIGCWPVSWPQPGPVEIATTGTWEGQPIGLTGGPSGNFNHAKVGVSLDTTRPFVIFGDLNQQGALNGKCASSQNGRGGLFYAVEDAELAASVSALLSGGAAAVAPN